MFTKIRKCQIDCFAMLILDINNNAIACPKVSVDACEIADCLKPRASEICPDVCTQGEYRLVIIICNCDF